MTHRQDWVRRNIRPIGNGEYHVEHADCYFETRKGIAKGYYLLRLSINAVGFPTLCSVSIEPVGPNKSLARTFTVPIQSTRSEPCLVLPIVVQQRSRVKIKPVDAPGAINATFSVLPTTADTLVDILRQWTTRKPNHSNKNTLSLSPLSSSPTVNYCLYTLFLCLFLSPFLSVSSSKLTISV